MDWIQKKQDNLLLSGVAPKVRTGGSATTGQAAPPHRNNQFRWETELYTSMKKLETITEVLSRGSHNER